MCPGDATQQQGEESQGQRALRAAAVKGLLQPQGLSYLCLAGIGYNFAGYAKQVSCKWLKMCLFELLDM